MEAKKLPELPGVTGTNNFTLIYGVDELLLSFKFMELIHEKKPKKIKSSYNRFKSFICCAIKRGINKKEEDKLVKFIIDFFGSEEGTNERIKSVNNIMKMQFLEK